jgi:putative intracellular protease/amidase
MDIRTRRALAAVAEMDRRHVPLCATCEGLLLTAAAGLPLPLVRDEDGELIDGEVYVDAMLDRILADGPIA